MIPSRSLNDVWHKRFDPAAETVRRIKSARLRSEGR